MNRWVAGARPRTLPAAVVPVVVGTAVASVDGEVVLWRAACALAVALAIQVGTNYANDYSDGVRGTDAERVGPMRLVGSGLASPAAVKRAALAAYAVAALAGLALALVVGPELVVVGLASFAAGWLYTGGPRPYGYAGLGELFVFVFFGVVATAGSAYVHLDQVTVFALVASIPVGLLATSLLVVNNLRDIDGDERAGKRTLAVRVGEPQTRSTYVGCIAFAFASVLYLAVGRLGALAGLLALPLAVAPVRAVVRGDRGPSLIAVLGATGRLQLVFGLLLAAGIV
ncbi:MAG TPA: 1,4-dihydroxy-2-naphthoate polyprenyltransferase, partial [Acidimicrobiales bacterium]|nr:1,4-dihydroxy-2-naphthoate polyprenyltransferase [Acidimicrobiales bacterium]